MRKLKDWPLAIQMWTIFTFVIVIIFALLSLYFSFTIRSFFTDETYNTIETAQKNAIEKATGVSLGNVSSNDIREVKHIRLNYFNENANMIKIERFISNETAAKLFLKKITRQAENQSAVTGRYIQRANSARILYVIRVNGNNGNFIVSYMWDTYRNSLEKNLMKKLFPVMIIALVISLIAAKYLAQRLVIPLRELAKRVNKIGKKQWQESIHIDRKDEIGELSKSIEEMRNELVNQDEYEQTMLQQTSHDLKTPLMVIRSYVKAIEDGIYPKGDLDSTIKVIDSEAEKMQKRIKNLIYLTKIKYMSKHQSEFKKVYLKDIVEQTVEHFFYNERNIKFELNLQDIEVIGDEEQWTVVFENIIDNELRYANTLIQIKMFEDSEHQYISLYNDGEKIPDDKLKKIFGVYNKENGGNFGLGLDIVNRIVTMYAGSIIAQNEEIGVSFIITLKR
ncbi:MAG: HAMP domain-containing sensor histidine kinase [Bacillota bacterium]|nr:HAMP domain-containing sensor histidine kinase [Bacillota bacterium]